MSKPPSKCLVGVRGLVQAGNPRFRGDSFARTVVQQGTGTYRKKGHLMSRTALPHPPLSPVASRGKPDQLQQRADGAAMRRRCPGRRESGSKTCRKRAFNRHLYHARGESVFFSFAPSFPSLRPYPHTGGPNAGRLGTWSSQTWKSQRSES